EDHRPPPALFEEGAGKTVGQLAEEGVGSGERRVARGEVDRVVAAVSPQHEDAVFGMEADQVGDRGNQVHRGADGQTDRQTGMLLSGHASTVCDRHPAAASLRCTLWTTVRSRVNRWAGPSRSGPGPPRSWRQEGR